MDEDGLFGKLFLRKWHPQPTVACAIGIFGSIGAVCIIFGVVVMVLNSQIDEFTIESYHQLKTCNNTYPQLCQITVRFPKMSGPVYMFYELTNFYQNHRRYVKSKSNNQLSNIAISSDEAKKFCDPVTRNHDLFDSQQLYYIMANGTSVLRSQAKLPPLDPSSIANPCGLIAKSVFNDTYQIFDAKGVQVKVKETDITWPNDAGTKFKSANNETSWIDVQNEHFIVWMRTAGLPYFRKLWGSIAAGFENADYTIVIQNNYNPATYQGAKNLFFSTSTAFGGKNQFLGVAFIVVGILCFLVAVFFQVYSSYSGKKYGGKSA